MSGTKTILFVFPTAWDRRQLAACRDRWEDRYEVVFGEPADETCPWQFDVLDEVERRVAAGRAGAFDGVASSSDYPGAIVAGAIATRLGLPGSPPGAVLRASHKYYSRLAQREAAPEATPPFALVDPRRPEPPPFGFPCFVKPVKGAFSMFSRRMGHAGGLAAFFARPAVQEFRTYYVWMFNRLVAAFTDFEVDGGWFLAEGLVSGHQATVEGFIQGGEVGILGVVDSVMASGTASFVRFDYPSALPEPVQARMVEVVRRVIPRLGLADTLFNVELAWDPARDRVFIYEVNPRMCGQFADLYEKVDGVNGYQVALALAAGERPRLRRREGPCAAAASYPLRVFAPLRVDAAPGADDLAAAEALFPGTLVWPECAAGQALTDFAGEDGRSCRYAVINLGAADRDALADRFAAVRDRLGYRFSRLAPPG
jgi:hypothetical protein